MCNFCKYPNQCGIGNDCTECYQDALAAAKARIAELEKALLAAVEEIKWWSEEHGCCSGHEGEVLDKVAALLKEDDQ